MNDTIKDAFDKASSALVQMQESIELLKQRFGERSKIYLQQKEWFDSFVSMQEVASEEINSLRHTNKLAVINSRAKDLIIKSLESGIPSHKLMEIYGG